MDSIKKTIGLIEDVAAFIETFRSAALKAGFACEQYGEIHGYPLLAFTKSGAGDGPAIYLSSGIHGNEPAPPRALLRLIERNFFDARVSWAICPMLNPTGMHRDVRENFQGFD
ncbi:MAG TPA: succinylglutamate desuccinylase/aspartoacylase family protein, partial [Opitutaceae bacterium]|nr:succinylglutamate desuccinylase/aspartoacylase family protein [Opitutaceae bacterium]